MIKTHWMRILVSCVVLGVVGCVGSVSPSGVEREATPLPEAPGREDMRLTPTPLRALERVPTTEATFVTGEVPDGLLAAILDDLVERAGVQREAVQIAGAEAVVWNDGSLGCPQPGMMYTQALVAGYRVVLAVDGKSYDYHASERGTFLLCEGGVTDPLPTPSLVEEDSEMTPSASVSPGLQPFVDQALADLAERLSIEVEQIEVVEAKAVVWPDGSLGCPQPGLVYTQVQQEGYLIRLRVDRLVYDYHGGGYPDRGPFLCEGVDSGRIVPPSPSLDGN
jgi:hypothetical protein